MTGARTRVGVPMEPITTAIGILVSAILVASLHQYSAAARAASSVNYVEIAPGVRMPLLLNGITKDHGVWLAMGGRGIDTAFLYGDEQQAQVGTAIAESDVPRESIFLVTKVSCCPTARCAKFCAKPPFPNSAGEFAVLNATAMLEHSLQQLRQPYADLVLLHFPCEDFRDTAAMWEQLEEAHARGWARAIGVSNFNATLLRRLLKVAKIKPAVVQNALSVAGHPPAHRGAAGPCQEGDPLYGSDMETLRFARRHRIAFSAYSPLGSISKVGVLDHPTVRRIAAANGRSAAQVALQWCAQQRIAAVTSTSNPRHVAEALDLDSQHWKLTRREMRTLTAAR